MQRLKKPDFKIVLIFIVVFAALIGPITYMLLRPTDPDELKNHLESLGTDISEAKYLVDHKNNSNRTYFRAHFEDLADNVSQTEEITQHTYYDPSIRDQRKKYFDLSDEISSTFKEISLAYNDQTQLKDNMNKLKRLEEEVNDLKKQI